MSSQFRQLFLRGQALLDLRAPVEFARGAFPQAHNLPLMTDAERAAVGSCYKQQGPEAAVALGHELVGGQVREQRIQTWIAFAQHHPDAVLYCFRGGMRSQIVQQWLAAQGVHMPRVPGGYKALRQYLLSQLQTLPQELCWWVLAGRTGSGKTHLLSAYPRHLDLEAAAQHRGSAFGRLPQPQPTPIAFENALAVAMLRLQEQSAARVLIEDESHLIGRLSIPPSLFSRMQRAPLIELQVPLELRVQQVLQDYVLDLSQRFVSAQGERGLQAHADYLRQSLRRIQRRLGGLRYQQLSQAMEQALGQSDVQAHCAWIAPLLADYYDPLYDHHMPSRQQRMVFQGDALEVREWLDNQARP